MGKGANDIWQKAADLVGEDVLRKLALHGLQVVDNASVERFVREHEKSNARIREVAAAAIKAGGRVALRLELEMRNDGTPVVIATMPGGDEKEAARQAAQIIANEWEPPEGWKRREDLAAASIVDTNDVDIAAKSGEEMDAAGSGS